MLGTIHSVRTGEMIADGRLFDFPSQFGRSVILLIDIISTGASSPSESNLHLGHRYWSTLGDRLAAGTGLFHPYEQTV